MAGASQGPGTRQNVGTDFLLDALGRGRTGGPPPAPLPPAWDRGGDGRGGGGGAGCRSDAGAAQGGAAQLGRGPRLSSLLVDLGQQQDEGQGQGAVVEAVHVGAVPLLQGAAGSRQLPPQPRPRARLRPTRSLWASAGRLSSPSLVPGVWPSQRPLPLPPARVPRRRSAASEPGPRSTGRGLSAGRRRSCRGTDPSSPSSAAAAGGRDDGKALRSQVMQGRPPGARGEQALGVGTPRSSGGGAKGDTRGSLQPG